MKVLILGGSGMLGHKLVQVLSKKFDVWTTLRGKYTDYINLDLFNSDRTFENVAIEKFDTVAKTIRELKPDAIINAIGVIKQKKESRNIIKTLEINSVLPHKVAELAKEVNARFITLSTDCVFDGKKGKYTEDDFPNAKDLYGKSKHLGEVIQENCLTIRTSIIGRELNTNKSLVEWFLNTNDNPVKGFTKAFYTGFPTIILAEIIADILENQQQLQGLYHISSDPINKYDLLCLIKDKLNLNKEIEPFSDFTIDRSLDSKRFRKSAKFTPLKWEEMIRRMLDDPTPYDEWRK